MRVVRRMSNLPSIENAKLLEEEFESCKALLNAIPAEEENAKGLHDMRTLFSKIEDEKNYWC